MNFDKLWKFILSYRLTDETEIFPNLEDLINSIRNSPHSNPEVERDFSVETDVKTKKRTKMGQKLLNAILLVKSVLNTKEQTHYLRVI